MKPIVFGLAIVLGGTTVAPLAAQLAQAAPSEPAHKVFVLTGCLTNSPSATGAFKLSGAVPVGQQTLPGRSAAHRDEKDVYELQPTSGLSEQGIGREEMQTHAGKKVEVTVRPVEVSPGPSSSSSSTTSTAKIDEVPPQRFTVSKIKTAAGSCL